MTPTHILLTKKNYDKMMADIAINWTPEDKDYDAIPVDLSEEGIRHIAIDKASESHYVNSFVDKTIYEEGYEQCAKDLLNTKP